MLRALLSTFVFLSVILPPWLFGGTPPWSVWILNSLCWAIGLSTLLIRFIPAKVPRHSGPVPPAHISEAAVNPPTPIRRALSRTLFILSGALVLYCFAGALNARAIYNRDQFQFIYLDCIRWLPHSLDRTLSIATSLDYLAYAAFFWGVHAYLADDDKRHTRLLRLVWVFVVNGSLVAFVSLLQKASDNGKLLWINEPRYNKDINDYFGPFAYRGNASQYLNLIWPAAIGLFFYSRYRNSRRARPSEHHRILIPLALIIFIGVFAAVSRGGILMALLGATAAVIFMLYQSRARLTRWAIPAIGLILVLGAAGVFVGGSALKHRFDARLDVAIKERGWGPTQEIAGRMAHDYPAYGTGAGTFVSVFQLYRVSWDEFWPAQLHNDWMETRITLGWVGFAAVLLAFGIILAAPWTSGAREISGVLPFFIYLSLGLTLIHARFDFPFQVHAVVMTFLVGCAILFSVTIRKRAES